MLSSFTRVDEAFEDFKRVENGGFPPSDQVHEDVSPSPLVLLKTQDYYDEYEFGIETKESLHADQKPLTPVELWASDVIDCSSYWDGSGMGGGNGVNQTVSYGPRNVIGPSTIYPMAGSNGSAWCPNNTSGPEFITLKYEQAIQIQKVHVYETSCPGATCKISAKRLSDGEWVVLYSGASVTNTGVRDFAPDLAVTDVVSDTIRLDLNMPGQWTEIDAVKIIGLGNGSVEIPPPLSPLCVLYKKLLMDGMYTDVVLYHQESRREIKALRAILAQRSPFLRKLIESATESHQNIVTVSSPFRYSVLMGAIDFIYSNHANLKACHVVETYVLSSEWGIPELAEFCVKRFKGVVNVENVIMFYREAKHHNCTLILDACFDFIVQNYKKVFLQDDLHTLTKQDLLIICRKLAKNGLH
ncbi:hypothetical protein C9374_004014 [Naegleria lovaniensis]|uniref:BTB domain-containing protein n=1 Tax=Naegleria lovaniensis TaxID=51637 RepID=A0AA88H0B1_NAELO|nr:uncharacterized protein C9374_004014 [Naegleria lovaniensis]KAG2394250.1 hypothetical protein C9374_004014 [Naegleria lovaniensis]